MPEAIVVMIKWPSTGTCHSILASDSKIKVLTTIKLLTWKSLY